MSLYALDNLDDALDVTRAFLTPIDRTLWVKLAFVVLFIGGPGANLNTFQFGSGGGGNGGPPPGDIAGLEVTPQFWLLIAGVVGVALLIGLAFALVGSILEFVFVESLRNETVSVRQYWGRRWRQGLRLFGFRLVIGLFVFGSVLLFGVLGFLFFDAIAPGTVAAIVLLVLPAFFALALVLGLVYGFTTVFVVPIMVLEDCGVLDGWRRLWPTITAQWKQYLAYAVASFFLSILGGILVAVVTAVLAVLLLIPFGILFALGIGLAALVAEPFVLVVGIVVGIPYVLAVIAVAALVQVPVQTYLRYYALLVLGDVEYELDLIPDQRSAIRESSTVE